MRKIHEKTFSEDKKAVLSVVKETWMHLRFDCGDTEHATRAFRWHLGPNAEGVEIEIKNGGPETSTNAILR